MEYRPVLLKGLRTRPLRVLSNLIYSYYSGAKAPMPFKLKFENTNLCNINCTMCPHSKEIGLYRKKGYLTFDNFKYVFDQVKPIYLNLTGIGEPFLNPHIYDIVKYSTDHKAVVKFDTNATLLNDEKIKKILDTNIDVISVSFDGATKETYEPIRVGAKFDVVIKNFKRLVELRNELKAKTQIHMFFVLQKGNLYDLPRFVKLAMDVGVDYLAGNFVIPLGFNINEKRNLIDIDPDELKKILQETRELCAHTDMTLGIDGLLRFLEKPTSEKSIHNQDAPCYLPWYAPLVTWDGFMGPCDFYCDKDYVFGNVFEEPFMKVWNSEAAQEFRKQLTKKRIGTCKTCGVDETYIQKEFHLFYKLPLINQLTHRQPVILR